MSIFGIVLFLLIGGMIIFMVWSQWRTRKRYKDQMDQLQVGIQVITIGGIYGTLTDLNREENRARLEIAPNVEIEISLRAISQQLPVSSEEKGPSSESRADKLLPLTCCMTK